MVVNGIVTRKVAMMPLLRVTDMKYEQSPLGRMLSYGTFVLESAGQDQALRKVKHLPNPNELYLRVVEEMYEPRGRRGPAGQGGRRRRGRRRRLRSVDRPSGRNCTPFPPCDRWRPV